MLVTIGWSTYVSNDMLSERKAGWTTSGTSVLEVVFGRIKRKCCRSELIATSRYRMPRAPTNLVQRCGAQNTTVSITHSMAVAIYKDPLVGIVLYFPGCVPGTFIGMDVARFFYFVHRHDSLISRQSFWTVVTFRPGNASPHFSFVFFELVRLPFFSTLFAKTVAHPACGPTKKMPGNLAPAFHLFGTVIPQLQAARYLVLWHPPPIRLPRKVQITRVNHLFANLFAD